MTELEIEELSRSLDQLNAGQIPSAGNTEQEKLVEIAALLQRADLPVSPPPHIQAATLQSAVNGMKVSARKQRPWMYSGLLGAAAALLIFWGLHGLPADIFGPTANTPQPQVQTAESPVPTAPQAIQPGQNAAAGTTGAATAPILQPPSSVTPASPSPENQQRKSDSLPAANPAPQPVAPKLAAKVLPAPSPDPTDASFAATLTPLLLPGRTPDSTSIDPATGILRQIYAAGTPQEIVIVQRRRSQENAAPPQARSYAAPEADTSVKNPDPLLQTVTVTIGSQEVTLSGRLPRQKLLELVASLKESP